MTRRAMVCALLALLALPVMAERRRAVSPGAGRCLFGVLAEEVAGDQIALDATHVYYVDALEAAVWRVSKQGGPPVRLAAFTSLLVLDIVVGDAEVYVATIPDEVEETLLPGTIFAVPKGGGTPRTLATGVVGPVKLAADASHVYWVSFGTLKVLDEEILPDGAIGRVKKDGSERQALASDLSAPFTLALDDAGVYFGETGLATGKPNAGMRRVAKSGGAVTSLQEGIAALELELAGNDIIIFGSTNDFLFTGLFSVPKSGGAARTLTLDDGIFAGPRIFEGFIYYLTTPFDQDAELLMRIPLAGGSPAVVREVPIAGADFELDACGVLFVDFMERVVRMPR